MNNERYRIVAIGKKHPNMMSDISSDLFDHGCNLYTIASLGVGASMVMVLIIDTVFNEESILEALGDVIPEYDLEVTISDCAEAPHTHQKSNAFFAIKGIASNGILKKVIKVLTHAGLNIHAMESDIFNVNDEVTNSVFVCNLKGHVEDGIESLSEAVNIIKSMDLKVQLASDWQLI